MMGFELICSAAAAAFLLGSLVWVYARHARGKNAKTGLLLQILCYVGVSAAMMALGVGNALAADGAAEAASAAGPAISEMGMGFLAAALATGLSGIGGGIAVAAAASAALGAISENEKMFGRSMIFVGLAEGIALYGLIISLMILSRI